MIAEEATQEQCQECTEDGAQEAVRRPRSKTPHPRPQASYTRSTIVDTIRNIHDQAVKRGPKEETPKAGGQLSTATSRMTTGVIESGQRSDAPEDATSVITGRTFRYMTAGLLLGGVGGQHCQ